MTLELSKKRKGSGYSGLGHETLKLCHYARVGLGASHTLITRCLLWIMSSVCVRIELRTACLLSSSIRSAEACEQPWRHVVSTRRLRRRRRRRRGCGRSTVITGAPTTPIGEIDLRDGSAEERRKPRDEGREAAASARSPIFKLLDMSLSGYRCHDIKLMVEVLLFSRWTSSMGEPRRTILD